MPFHHCYNQALDLGFKIRLRMVNHEFLSYKILSAIKSYVCDYPDDNTLQYIVT